MIRGVDPADGRRWSGTETPIDEEGIKTVIFDHAGGSKAEPMEVVIQFYNKAPWKYSKIRFEDQNIYDGTGETQFLGYQREIEWSTGSVDNITCTS